MTTHSSPTVVITGGELHTSPMVDVGDFVIAADSGYDHALAHGIAVDLLVGDLDSISPAGLAHAHDTGTPIDQHPMDKDDTDLELALRLAIERGTTSIAIYGGEGGSIAHLLAVALSQANPMWAANDVVWHTRTGTVRTATGGHTVKFSCDIGDTVTLVPAGGASGVTTAGLRWKLSNARLMAGTSLGVSNKATASVVTVEVDGGAVLVIHEGAPTE